MDHHCPVTNNCVGKNNRVWFLLTGIFVLISSSVTGYLAFMAWYRSPKTRFCDVFTWIILFSGWTSALNASVGTLTRALFNVTTNELVNWPRKYIFNASKCSERSFCRQLNLDHGFLHGGRTSENSCARGTVLIKRMVDKLGERPFVNCSDIPINTSTNNISDGFEPSTTVRAQAPCTVKELRKVSEQVVLQPDGSDLYGSFQLEAPATLTLSESDEGRGHVINEVPDEGAYQFFLPVVDEAKPRNTARGKLFTFVTEWDDRSFSPCAPLVKRLPSKKLTTPVNTTKLQRNPQPKRARTLIKRPEPALDSFRSIVHKSTPVHDEVYCVAAEWRAFLISQTSSLATRRPPWNMGTKVSDSSKPIKRRQTESVHRNNPFSRRPLRFCRWSKMYVHRLTDPVNRVTYFNCTAPRRPDSIEVKLCSSTHLAQSVAATTLFALRSTATSGALSGEIYYDRTVKSSASPAPEMEDSKVATLIRERNLEEAVWHQVLLPPPSDRLQIEGFPEIRVDDMDEDAACTVISDMKDSGSSVKPTNSIRILQTSHERSAGDSDTSITLGDETPSNVISSLIPTYDNNLTSTWGTSSGNDQRPTSTALSVYSPKHSPGEHRMGGTKVLGCLCGPPNLKTGRPIRMLAGASSPQIRPNESISHRFFRGLHERLRRMLASGR
ncbi:hypothetical protein SprV_0200705000 [Sparganum proliferum]